MSNVSHQKKVQLELKSNQYESCVQQHEKLIRYTKSESELWSEKQRKQIRHKRKRLQINQKTNSSLFYLESSSSTSSMTESSNEQITNNNNNYYKHENNYDDETDEDKEVQKELHDRCKNRRKLLHQRHRRYTLDTIARNHLLMAKTWHSKSFIEDKHDKTDIPNNHRLGCSCALCLYSRDSQSKVCEQKCRKQLSSKPVWKVIKPAKVNTKNQSETQRTISTNVPTLVVMTNCDESLVKNNFVHPRHNNSTFNTVNRPIYNLLDYNSDSNLTHPDFSNRSELDSPLNPIRSPEYEFEPVISELENDELCRTIRNSIVEQSKSSYSMNQYGSSTISAGAGSTKVLVPRNYQINRTKQTRLSNPRIHSMQGLTRAKIKTVKITLVVITCYVLCSSPFICVQLWAQWWPGAQETSIWQGKFSL